MKLQSLLEDQWARDLAKANREKLKKATEEVKRQKAELKAQLAKAASEKKIKNSLPMPLEKLWNKIVFAVSNSFPDGDPIDHLFISLGKNSGVTMDHINKAVSYGLGKKTTFDKYMSDMWSDCQRDAIADAEKSKADNDSPFYMVQQNGKIVPTSNPWK